MLDDGQAVSTHTAKSAQFSIHRALVRNVHLCLGFWKKSSNVFQQDANIWIGHLPETLMFLPFFCVFISGRWFGVNCPLKADRNLRVAHGAESRRYLHHLAMTSAEAGFDPGTLLPQQTFVPMLRYSAVKRSPLVLVNGKRLSQKSHASEGCSEDFGMILLHTSVRKHAEI